MHLKQLKLAGFKSFVDPTQVPFPSQLVAVVGPNGCGKSNIIDAVRWVMGESSAKNLRGESMTDVIFNGSSNRKAVGQASVELIFDNSMGRLGGQYTSYQEIAVKRVVTRDGESSYYLNGSRCRRRDITDIFLGTGAGARGYSIIGQGSISRIVEARPEELRAYFEEAAGVSKYKERRRETLLRIEHTRENLTRVADIRDELDKVLQRLERQAKTAERYKILRAEERLCKAEILALKWQALSNEQKTRQTDLKRFLIDYEAHQSKVTEAYKQGTKLREKLHESNASFQESQAKFYQLATEIARLEENIQQQQREKIRLKDDQQQLQVDWQNAAKQLQEDQENLASSEALFSSLVEKSQTLQGNLDSQQQALREKQEQQSNWNIKKQEAQSVLTKTLNDLQMEELRAQHLTASRQQFLARLEKINEELRSVELDSMNEALKIQQETFLDLENQAGIEEANFQQLSDRGEMLRQQLSQTEKDLHQAQDQLHGLKIQQASLVAAQQAALGKEVNRNEAIGSWADSPRLVESIKVDKDWRLACEFVLAEGLQAIVVDSLDSLWSELPKLEADSLLFLTKSLVEEKKNSYPSLADKIKGFKPSWSYCLDKIYTASSLNEALAWLAKIENEESVITKEGYWLGKGWVKVAGLKNQDAQSLLLRQDELAQIEKQLRVSQSALEELREQRDRLHSQVKENEQEQQATKKNVLASREAVRTCEAEINLKNLAIQQASGRKNALVEEEESLRLYLEDIADQQMQAEELISLAKQDAQKYEQALSELRKEGLNWDETLHLGSKALEEARVVVHQHQLEVDREKMKIQQLKDNLRREQARLETLGERLETLASRLIELENPGQNLNESLQQKIGQHAEFESSLTAQREQLEQLNGELEALELEVRTEEKHAKAIQEKMQQEQIQEQSLAVRAGAMLEALAELEVQLDDLLPTIPPGISLSLREQELQDIVDKINRLGAINLAAIEEYETEFQRKQHLDEQHQDLIEALATLDAAIEKMDKETQQRLNLTFDEVNTAFQALFPPPFWRRTC